jgi:hypothetical protein
MFVSVLVRRLRAGKTYDDFIDFSTDETVARNRSDR